MRRPPGFLWEDQTEGRERNVQGWILLWSDEKVSVSRATSGDQQKALDGKNATWRLAIKMAG